MNFISSLDWIILRHTGQMKLSSFKIDVLDYIEKKILPLQSLKIISISYLLSYIAEQPAKTCE